MKDQLRQELQQRSFLSHAQVWSAYHISSTEFSQQGMLDADMMEAPCCNAMHMGVLVAVTIALGALLVHSCLEDVAPVTIASVGMYADYLHALATSAYCGEASL